MASSDSMRAYMASHVINLFPSLVRAELLSDSELLGELGLARVFNILCQRSSVIS